LAMNRLTGTLSVTTGAGAGELRILAGEVVDAVFRRLDGEKALYRLLTEKEGRFAFLPVEPPATRRIDVPTSALLMEAMRQIDEAQRLRQGIAPAGEALFLEELGEGSLPIYSDIAALLQIPRSLDELLDELPHPDLTILEA